MKYIHKYKSNIHGNYFRKSLLYGVVTAIGMSAVLMIRYLLGGVINSPLSYIDSAVMLVFVSVSVYVYRLQLKDRTITFKEGWLTGFVTGGVASVLYGMFLYCYVSYIDTQMPERCADNLRQVPDYADMTLQQLSEMARPSFIVVQSIIYNVVVSVLWAFIAALLFRNEKAETL